VTLADVGYGVRQVLPVIVESVLADRHKLFLVQQPEVRLHPKGQAALGTFFATLVAKEDKHLAIETHSDFLVDRVRLEVAKGTIRSEDVLILFFERRGIKTKVHTIMLDQQGNVTGAPRSYRNFFLSEESSILGRAV